MSRLERVLQGRLAGRKAARTGPLSGISDRWHNRLFTLPKNPRPATLSQYGWSRFPLLQQAILVGLAVPLYGVGLSHLLQKFDKNPGPGLQVMVYGAAFVLPVLTAAITLRSRRVRMASELLRPANRTAFFNSLFQSLAKRSMLFWLTMHAGALVVWITHQTSITQGDPTQLAIGFLLLSLAVQLPVFALGLRMAQWSSPLLFFVGCYVLGHLEIGLLVGWTILQKTYGPIPTAGLASLVLIALGLPLQTWARNAWLRAELG